MVKTTEKMKKVLAEIAKTENINEADVFELCDKYELNAIEESNVFDMFYKTFVRSKYVLTSADFEPVKMPNVNTESPKVMLTAGFGTE